MTVPVSIDVIRNKLASYCKMLETHWIQKQKIPDGYGPYSVTLHVTDFGAIKVQFLTLGLIEESIKPKAENSAQKILWKLSPRGLQYMRDVIAQRKQKTDC